MARTKNQPAEADADQEQPKAKRGPKTNGKAVTKMKILADEPTESVEEFQTGEALSSRSTQTTEAPAPQTLQSKGVKINHVKLIKDLFLFVDFDKSDNDGMTNNKMRCEAPIHDDLRNALAKLNVHCATLGGQYNSNGQIDTAGVRCVGMTVRTGNVYGVKLIGIRTLEENKQINVLPPFTKLTEGSTYVESDLLEKAIDEVIAEVKLYLGGKHKPDAQGAFDFPETPTIPSEVHPAPQDSPYVDEAY